MPTYTYLCLDDAGSIPPLELRDLAGDTAALAAAPQILRLHRTCTEVEIWQGSRFIGCRKASRRDPPATRFGARF